jgi:hypothetical protein
MDVHPVAVTKFVPRHYLLIEIAACKKTEDEQCDDYGVAFHRVEVSEHRVSSPTRKAA